MKPYQRFSFFRFFYGKNFFCLRFLFLSAYAILNVMRKKFIFAPFNFAFKNNFLRFILRYILFLASFFSF